MSRGEGGWRFIGVAGRGDPSRPSCTRSGREPEPARDISGTGRVARTTGGDIVSFIHYSFRKIKGVFACMGDSIVYSLHYVKG